MSFLERAQNEPIAVPAILASIALFLNDLLTTIDGQTWYAAVPAVIALIARFFVTGPQTAAREAADAIYGGDG